MKKYCLVFMLLFMISIDVHARPECVVSNSERAQLLALDYKQFDQSLPDGGWRSLDTKGCFVEGAQIIEEYLKLNGDKLEGPPLQVENQKKIMRWHAGQLYALAGLTEKALILFETCYDEVEVAPEMILWNPYVRGTIAFLRKDLKTLKEAREECATVRNEHNDRNIHMLDGMIKCFDQPYSIAYGRCEL